MPTPDRARRPLRAISKFVLIVITLVCLASMGGAMALAAPMLIPGLWMAGRSSGPWQRGMWTVLAALSAAEAAWIYGYWLGGEGSELLFWMPIAAASTVVILFTGSLGSRSPRDPDPTLEFPGRFDGPSFPREFR